MAKKSGENRSMIVVGTIVAVLLFPIVLLLIKQPAKEREDVNALLSDGLDSSQKFASKGKYADKVCSISFDYPQNWQVSDVKLTLPQPPLSQTTFNEPAKGNSPPKSSIFSFLCYDARQYSFDQFIAQNAFGQKQGETISAGNIKWQRRGNFVYAVKNEKLYIFQMFFTKYDLKPESGYEGIFLDIIRSVR